MQRTETTVTFTRDEIVAEIEAGARRAVGLSAAEFVKTLRQHTLAVNVVDLIVLVNLLPEDDPLCVTDSQP